MQLCRATLSTPLGDMLALSVRRGTVRAGVHRPAQTLPKLETPADALVPAARDRRQGIADDRADARMACALTSPARARISTGLPLDMRGAAFERRCGRRCGDSRRRDDQLRRDCRGARVAGASRAVGAANGANPVAIIVPCHRVIGASAR
jgi:O6-methylguanine-DNA--protein-cysteine methyltransferase